MGGGITLGKVKQALQNGRLQIGTWLQTNSPVSAEILAHVGFDWIVADCEHSETHIAEFSQIARGIYGRDTETFVRVRENDLMAIRQFLDMGANGVIVPLVNTAEDAKRAVAAAKYPPVGIRGFGWARCNNWGMDFDRYAATANDEIAVIVMIESKEAVENIDEILSVDGVDGVFIGPYDMSGSYGCVGDTENPIVRAACSKVAAECKKHRKTAGRHIVIPTQQNVAQAIAEGFTFIALGTDIAFLSEGANKAKSMVLGMLKE